VQLGVRVLILSLAATALGGCFDDAEVKRTGSVGDEHSAGRIEVTVERIDRETRVPKGDITGLSVPRSGYRLVGVLVNVCTDYGSAIGQYDFKLETSDGPGRLKFPANNYREDFSTVRDGCKRGWIVYEIPRGSSPTEVRFAFDDSGSNRNTRDNLEARFEWKVE
jgi:hypothetical protein